MSMYLLICTISSCIAGCLISRRAIEALATLKYRNSILVSKSSSEKQKNKSLSTQFFDFALRESAKLRAGGECRLAVGILSRCSSFKQHRVTAGLSSSITEIGFCEARVRLALFIAILGGVLGFVISQEMCITLALCGATCGFISPNRWLAQASKARTNSLESHLPEMLDVMSICMQSGLSFDKSLDIYQQSFSTFLSRELSTAKTLWTSGLKTREVALRDIAKSYNSVIFDRCTETIIRSLRLGSSMTEELAAAAREARSAYRTKREEEVAKAPVKMMIPTGTLILPAMLLLVLGPVLLELAGGGV